MVAQDPVEFGAESFDGAPRRIVEVICTPTDDCSTQGVEGVCHQHEFACCIDIGALTTLRVPRIADLEACDRGHNIVVARAADDCFGGFIDDRKSHPIAFC